MLLDALGAIGPHRDAVALVGTQAVYLRVGDADPIRELAVVFDGKRIWVRVVG